MLISHVKITSVIKYQVILMLLILLSMLLLLAVGEVVILY